MTYSIILCWCIYIFKNKNCGEPAQFTQLFLGRKRDETFLSVKTNIIHSVKFQEVSTVPLAVIECVWQCFVFLRWQIALAVLNVSDRFRIVAPTNSLAVIECVWQSFVFLCWQIALAVIECVWQCFVFLRWQIAAVWLNVTAFCIFVLTDSLSCDGMCLTVFCIFVLTNNLSYGSMCLKVFFYFCADR